MIGSPAGGGVAAISTVIAQNGTATALQNGHARGDAKRNRKRDGCCKHPRNHRRLARAIFAERDEVTVGRELLKCESATVKARIWETLVNYSLGEFASAGGAGKGGSVQIVWDMPAPDREYES